MIEPKAEEPSFNESKTKINRSKDILSTNDELRQLMMACYFEKKLSKPMVQAINLKHTLRVMQTLVEMQSIDFRAITPLIVGLSKVF